VVAKLASHGNHHGFLRAIEAPGTRLLVASKPISFSLRQQDHHTARSAAFQLDHSLHNLRQVGQVLLSMISAWLALMLAMKSARQLVTFIAP